VALNDGARRPDVLSRSGFAVRHVISSRGQPVAGEYEHMIEGSSPPLREREICKGMQASMFADLQRGTAGRGRCLCAQVTATTQTGTRG
jgi:hypothetical protein